MSRPSYHQRSASVGKVDYSNLFHSGLQAISDSTQGHRRSMSTPPSLEALPSPTPSSIRSSIRSNFWSLGSQSSDRDDTSSQWAERSAPNSSASIITGESTPEFRDVWMIKGVPLQLGLSRTLSEDSDLSPSRLVSLDPLAPSPAPAATSFFIDLSDGSDSSENSPTSSDLNFYRDDSFLSLHSVSPDETKPIRSRSAEGKRSLAISIQTKSIPSVFSLDPVDRVLDLQSPAEFSQTRLDVLPQSAVDADLSHLDFYGVEDAHHGDWRQFHADWISDQQEVPFSPVPYSPYA